MAIRKVLKTHLWVWFAWLLVFYALWLFLVVGLGYWSEAKAHWPIALAMALGSYVAGSTPMGGGSVGFPVLVLWFDMPATLGRDFSFAVQSIGMTSASILILARRTPLAWSILKGAALGIFIGLPLGIFFVAPYTSDLWIKIIFAVVWASFGILHLFRINEIASHSGMIEFSESWDFKLGILLGALSGVGIVSVTGVGIDMVLYAALVLLFRADLKIAIPTSVVIMAIASLYGVLLKSVSTGMQVGVYEHWLAAAPVVVLGAPLGVFIVNLIARKPTLLVVAFLCVGQFVWTCVNEYKHLQLRGLILAAAGVVLMLCLFEKLRGWGERLAGQAMSASHNNDSGHSISKTKSLI